MLFSAKFADNSFIEETSLENSPTYGDILRKEKQNIELEAFCLTDGQFYALIDFNTARWEINDQTFWINKFDYPNKLRLIYYKTRGVNLSENGYVESIPDIFNMGFQTNDEKGKNIKQILQIFPNGIVNFIIE